MILAPAVTRMAEFTEQTQTREGRAKPDPPLPAPHRHSKLTGADPLSLGNARPAPNPAGFGGDTRACKRDQQTLASH